ncbi:MAG TPA: queuosine precursor transporter [Candidatus Saccharimonadales bacterium]|nr:queuosine precursor transporter [Candidatus Saccharimonadales bacterium]
MLNIRKFDLLLALYIFGIMVAELMGAKTFAVATIGNFHLNASVAIFVMPLLFTSIDVIVEVYGKERARSIVRVGLIIVALQILTALLFTHLAASKHYAEDSAAYNTIFGTSVRFGIASIAAFAASEFLDVSVFSRLRLRMHGQRLWLRNNVANFVSQFVDSSVFVILAFYTFSQTFSENFSFLLGIIIPYYLVRCAMSILETPLVYLGVRWLKSAPGKLQSQSKLITLPAED